MNKDYLRKENEDELDYAMRLISKKKEDGKKNRKKGWRYILPMPANSERQKSKWFWIGFE